MRGLARRIRSLREARGLTQEDFAARCGISASFASLLERGERSPSYDTLVQVAAGLDVPLADLFLDEDVVEAGAWRLVELVREHRLTRAEVDQLLAVTRAVLSPRVPPAPVAERARCGAPDCEGPVLARGLCGAHYHRARRARAPREG